MDTARALAQEGRGVLLAIHDLCLALRGADRVVVLEEGRVCMDAGPEAVFHSGVLTRIFGSRLCRVETPGGWRYFYE
jgi:iron complex transport system ATP-binding protein